MCRSTISVFQLLPRRDWSLRIVVIGLHGVATEEPIAPPVSLP